jgi:ribosome-binding protein aMBF1 (putative translation factor)
MRADSLRTFGAVVQALREHAGRSRVEFAERVRFSKHTVESVELGRRMPDESFVERTEEVLTPARQQLLAVNHARWKPAVNGSRPRGTPSRPR